MQLVPVHLDLPLFRKSHLSTWSAACVILYHVTGIVQRAYSSAGCRFPMDTSKVILHQARHIKRRCAIANPSNDARPPSGHRQQRELVKKPGEVLFCLFLFVILKGEPCIKPDKMQQVAVLSFIRFTQNL